MSRVPLRYYFSMQALEVYRPNCSTAQATCPCSVLCSTWESLGAPIHIVSSPSLPIPNLASHSCTSLVEVHSTVVQRRYFNDTECAVSSCELPILFEDICHVVCFVDIGQYMILHLLDCYARVNLHSRKKCTACSNCGFSLPLPIFLSS